MNQYKKGVYYMTELVFTSVRKMAHADWLLRGPEKAVGRALHFF